MLHVAKRPFFLLAGASVSASAGFMYLGEDDKPLSIDAIDPTISPNSGRTMKRHLTRKTRSRTLKATSRQELGLQQSLIRDVACWISSASVASTRQAFTTPSVPYPTMEEGKEVLEVAMKNSLVYQNLVSWLQQISPEKNGWDPDQILSSSSFSMLVNLLSDTENNFSLHEDLEEELYRAMSVLSTNPQCAQAIAERATRYGKQALLNLAEVHDDDPRVGDALHQLVALDSNNCHFGPANLASLLSLAVADVPDQYLEFALWGLTKAATPEAVSRGYKLRKMILGDDSTTTTRRKLINSDKLWDELAGIGQEHSELVHIQAARLINELSNDAAVAQRMRRHVKFAETFVKWMNSSHEALACASIEIVAKLSGIDHGFQQQLVDSGALDTLRARILEDSDRKVTAKVLEAIRCLASPTTEGVAFVLDQDALSFVSDSGDGEPLYDDDIENINIVLRHGYVDGWIELFTAFLKSGDEKIREEAALCLEQIATYGSHKDEVVQEWLIAVLDSVLDKVPPEVAQGACSVQEARSRTRPVQGKTSDTSSYEASHAKALRALAFVMERTECQEELVRRGGIPILKILLRSENGLVQREAARVLANLFACDDMADELRDFAMNDCQLEAALEKWTQSEDIRLESMAHRARSNRRYQISRLRGVDMDNEVKYLDGIHPLHLSGSTRDQQSDYDVDIVFVHGLLGCPFSTWTCGEEEDTVWAQQWLLDDMKQEGLNPRVLSVGYDSQLLASGSIWKPLCFEETGSEILSQLNAARVGCGDRPVVFVTHSLGGVLLKQVLMASATPEAGEEESSLIDNVNGVVFFGVPHHGSPVAQRIQTFKPRQITQHPVTEHLHGTPHLEMLNDWCSEVFEEKDIPCLSVGESLPCRLPVISVEALVVPPTSANPGFGEFVPISDATHVDVCKPATTYDLRYKLVRKFISKNATTSATTQSKQRRL
ncbi:hypothetical protein PC129_g3754 [Phytophthora cactorum]|uniref:Alpha/Beta hydrolase fold n=1 Tax=Phytophthora cactorum TaxID=29920 RepID=A0A329SS56_9STRA|nr:hypothetical protein Pcac1_g19879 [Phytophthora cactorum]KAG2830840.1 hypothetical protein PC112_g7545 [Phytophthora cactorum]KAG2833419.1 hypothetical protein PC111_g6227 [Phytophthora cactorum]KAG2861021.1 hypothetical protein PC113_g7545 [Phytophthora cactorum]KAG2916379.1 hypothetical protein PC114_g7540 [Phytophthora cactorum]